MTRNAALLLASVLLSAILGVGLLRWLAPELFGGPVSLRLVRSAEEVPPFYDGIFRPSDYATPEFLINDPVTIVRARPLLPTALTIGPNDLLGFRNRAVPNIADFIAIGDSQTYGNNVSLEENWPSILQSRLASKGASVYAMATGGWGAVQYLDMFTKATALQPLVVAVAFYTGNDPVESFTAAYGDKRWADLRPDPNLSAKDAPKILFPAPVSEHWRAVLPDGTEMTFTPSLRLTSNRPDPAVDAGYGVMWRVAQELDRLAEGRGVHLLLTVIPTKELVYAPVVAGAGLAPPADYSELVEAERTRIAWLSERLRGLAHATYVDVVSPLQDAAQKGAALYPTDMNGHPIAQGYAVIGEVLARAAEPLLPPKRRGLYLVTVGVQHLPVLIGDDGVRSFASAGVAEANGWQPGKFDVVSGRELADLPLRGVIVNVDPSRYGPQAHQPATPR